MTSTFKAGYVGLIGQPNAGKSTLLNALIGEKVAIVTPKPQTTRQRVVGLLNTPKAQICFVDAPGVIRAKKGLNRFLEKEYSDVIEQSDVLVAVLNLDEEKFEALEQVLKLVASARRPWLAIVTKDDLPIRHRMPILRHLVESYGVPLIEISAEQRPEELADGLVAALVEKLPPSPGPLFDPELYTTSNVRELVSEIVREKCFLNLHQEIPFNLAVRMRSFVENEGPSVKIHAEIVVGKENHRPMVLGVKGERIKTIGTEARKDIEKLVGRSVFLDLHVALKKNWVGNESMMQELGYVVKQH